MLLLSRTNYLLIYSISPVGRLYRYTKAPSDTDKNTISILLIVSIRIIALLKSLLKAKLFTLSKLVIIFLHLNVLSISTSAVIAAGLVSETDA